MSETEAGDRWDVMIVTTGGEEIHRQGLPGDVAAEFEDLPFTAPDEVAVVVVKQRW